MSTTRFQVRFEVSGDGQVKAAIGDVGKAADQLERSGERAARGMDRLQSAAKVAGAVLGTALVAGLYGIIRNTVEAERVQAQLEARLKSTGQAAGLTLGQLNDMAGGLQKVTAYGDEAIGEAQGLLLTFTRIGRDVFPRALETVLDMSTALGQDLKQSSIQLGKALNDPIEGVTALTRVGVQFTKAQEDQIEKMVEAGDVAGAQTIILKELETQMGGSARAARDTLGGAFESLKNAAGDLLEGEGGSLEGLTGGINTLTDTLQSESTKAAFASFINGLAEMANFALTAITRIYELRQAANIAGAGGNLGGASESAASERLAQINRELKKVQDAKDGSLTARAGILARMDLTNPAEWSLGGQESALVAERQRIMQQLQQRRVQAREDRLMEGMQFIRGTEPPKLDSGGGGGGGGKARKAALTEEQKAAAALARAYESMNGSLHRQEELFGATGEAAKLRYELEHGALVGLEPALAAELMQRAERIDQMEAEADAQKELDRITKEREDAINRGIEATARLISDMEFELALMSMGNAEREREIALRYAGAHATEEQRARIAELADEMTRAQKEQALWNDIQRDTADMLFELSEDLGNAEEIIKGFLDSVAANIRRSIAEDWSESITNWAKNLFKNAGSGGGGGGGGFWSSILGWFGKGMADGGLVHGPGTGTSDSIPARLSAGEFVVRASAVDRVGADFLEAINTGRMPAFAMGGMVGATGSGRMSANDPGWGGGDVYHISVGVEGRVDRYTRAQAADEIRRSLEQNARNRA